MDKLLVGLGASLLLSAGAAGAAPYSPCPPKGTPCAIMPAGDSITAGFPKPDAGGYRVPLFHRARSNGRSITLVGSFSNGPPSVDGEPFPPNHEGHSASNIDATQGRPGISSLLPVAIARYRPHIVLLMIGTNDVHTGETLVPARLGHLMDSILAADPKLLLVVARIIPQRGPSSSPINQRVRAFNEAITGLVKARAEAGQHVAMVDMYAAFTANPRFATAYLADRLHPSPAGYALMADVWYAAIERFLR